MIRRYKDAVDGDGVSIHVHPDSARSVGLCDYLQSRTVKAGWGRIKEIEDVLVCPHCEHSDQIGEKRQGAHLECGQCGLQMQIFGAGLWIWGRVLDEADARQAELEASVDTCTSCRFFKDGHCLRFPPKEGGVRSWCSWPSVNAGDWCGEFQRDQEES